MPKYGRRNFRKAARNSKGSRRHTRGFKKSRGRSLKRFARQLNAVAEKKSFYFNAPNAFDTQAHTLCNDNTQPLAGLFSFMYANLAQGTGRGQRVGSQIFIRKIVIKGEFFNTFNTNGATSIVGFWLAREKAPLAVFGQTRNSIITAAPFTIIPDFQVVGWQCIKKKHGFVQQLLSAASNNTVVLYKGTMAYNWHFKIKLNFFKSMHFETGGYKISDGLFDMVPIPWIDTGVYNTQGAGINNIVQVRVTYTDV